MTPIAHNLFRLRCSDSLELLAPIWEKCAHAGEVPGPSERVERISFLGWGDTSLLRCWLHQRGRAVCVR